MAKNSKAGASRRKPIRKQRQAIEWSTLMRYGLVIFSMVAVIGVVSYSERNTALPILHVTVEGDFKHVDKQAFMDAVTPYASGSFFNVDVARLRAAGEVLPWVKQIQVRRVWPDSLHLIVEEQVAVARWQDSWLVNNKGETFLTTQNDIPAGLTMLRGPEKSHEVVVHRYQEMATKMYEHGLIIEQLEMDKRRAWNLILTNGMKVRLGRANSEQRFTRFIRVYQSELEQYSDQIAVMDMRYTNGLSVIWKKGQKPNFNGTV